MEPNPAAPAAGRLAGRTTHLSGKTGARSSGRKGNALAVISMFAYGLKHTIPGCQQQPGCQQRPEHDSDPIHCSFDANQCKLFNVTLQSQRDCVLQPRVAESARLPWVNHGTGSQRGCVHLRSTTVATPSVGVEVSARNFPQGSSRLATLGSTTERRNGAYGSKSIGRARPPRPSFGSGLVLVTQTMPKKGANSSPRRSVRPVRCAYHRVRLGSSWRRNLPQPHSSGRPTL